MKRILLVAATTGYQTRAFDEAARNANIALTLATDRCHKLDDPWGDRAIALRFEDPENSAASIDGGFDGVLAVGDRPAYIASLAAARLGLRFHPPEAADACADKFLARRKFRAAGMLTPWYRRITLARDRQAEARATEYPCVIKPVGLSGSRGVIRANNQEEFVEAFRRIQALLMKPELARIDGDRAMVIERFIPGQEFALEGLVTAGHLRTLAIFDKPDPLDGPYFEETIYTTPSREPEHVQRAIRDTTTRAAQALGLTDGPLHAEMRVNERGVWMLEVAARPIGGLCAKTLRFGRPPGFMPFEEVLLRHAAGEEVSALEPSPGASGVMMIPIPRAGIFEGVDRMEEARSVDGVEDVIITAKEGQELVPLPEGASYLGFIFARAAAAEQVEQALRAAHSALHFHIATALPVVR